MARALRNLERRKHIAYVDDERNLDHGIIVTLEDGWCFKADPGCGVRGFDTVAEAIEECARKNCYKN